MSEFFLALEQAARDRAARDGGSPNTNPAGSTTTSAGSATPPAGAVRRRERELVRPLAPVEVEAPRRRGLDPKFVALCAPASVEADRYRTLGHFVQQRGNGHGFVVAVTSAGPGEGKTTTAVNLAGALAQASRTRTLLIDADLRGSDVARRLGLGDPGARTLGRAVQSREATLDRLVWDLSPHDIMVLPAGPPVPSPYDLLAGARFREILDEARARFAWVVVDTQALTPTPDCRPVVAASDGVLLVVAAHRTTRDALYETARDVDPARLLGVVVNRADREPAPGRDRSLARGAR